MTQQLKEQISAFVDDELSEAEASVLLRRLAQDPDLQREAESMLRLRHAMRGESSIADANFSERVAAAIRGEAGVDVGGADHAITDVVDAPRNGVPGWMQWLGGGAIAATVAAFVVTSLPTQQAGQNGAAVAVSVPTSVQQAPALNANTNTNNDFEYVVPASLNDSGLVSASPELAAYFLSHSSSGPSLVPGDGRARMLAEQPQVLPMQDDDEASADQDNAQ